MSFEKIDLKKLEFNEIGDWPFLPRVAALCGVFCATLALGYFLFVSGPIEQYSAKSNQQRKLRAEFQDKYHKSANLEFYKEQMSEMQETLRVVLQQLPSEGKIPELMEDISTEAAAARLEFNLIKPGIFDTKEFYTELPIQMLISGNYHGFGKFISGIAMLPRIVTLHDFEIKLNISPNKKTAIKQQDLLLDLQAKTYWCADKESL